MLNLITRTMLTSAMGFAWTLIRAGEGVVAFGDKWGADDQQAGVAERFIWTVGRAITAAAERLGLAVNGIALWLGYDCAHRSMATMVSG